MPMVLLELGSEDLAGPSLVKFQREVLARPIDCGLLDV